MPILSRSHIIHPSPALHPQESNGFLQQFFDNADADLRILDSLGTFRVIVRERGFSVPHEVQAASIHYTHTL